MPSPNASDTENDIDDVYNDTDISSPNTSDTENDFDDDDMNEIVDDLTDMPSPNVTDIESDIDYCDDIEYD